MKSYDDEIVFNSISEKIGADTITNIICNDPKFIDKIINEAVTNFSVNLAYCLSFMRKIFVTFKIVSLLLLLQQKIP